MEDIESIEARLVDKEKRIVEARAALTEAKACNSRAEKFGVEIENLNAELQSKTELRFNNQVGATNATKRAKKLIK